MLRIAVVGGGVSGLSSALHLSDLAEKGLVSIDIYPGPTSQQKRDIGVGVWSTALLPFAASSRQSHQSIWKELLAKGKWLREVGYRDPSGSWLARSVLPSQSFEQMPGLLFLRESDLIETLESALSTQEQTTIRRVHEDSMVIGFANDCNREWSAPLMLENDVISDNDYHLIVAADGTNSNLRQLHEPGELANSVEDRQYAVLRANAPLTTEQTGCQGTSFQTWGEGQSMRFATVPLSYSEGSEEVERQVWFATTNSMEILNENCPLQRKDALLSAFQSWHDPICRMIEASPAEEIMMERAISHKNALAPVTNARKIIGEAPSTDKPSESGPCLVFVGDAFMTVDPILAQGFTLGLEGAYHIRQSVGLACSKFSSDLAFNPLILRKALLESHKERSSRYTKLLRATELVQALGQPRGSHTGFVCKSLIRPSMRVTPEILKTPIFNAMLKYSLGV